ncbi:hypothetical protein M408DRAFT_304973 [Serendipita vermifera MAFF 305830]|uniref:Programmed cell death protein 2 C-terminal domain-containing protein n=1 Tax=Serendipita vermifera MAFF 305830 TaxID=933852 RepID=A0A0C2W463_SERVB|nr:hypothetical protein M408DRAFT_304973 [Serendipita vermifera MAFF 305830]
MPQKQSWSDSDEDQSSGDERGEGYTSVHLGIPSDAIDNEEDIQDPYVSRIGGTPAFLSYPHPSPDASKCKVCNSPSELLVQILCNLEDNPFERVLYVWGCSKSTCQKKDGAIRAWRGLKLDEKYARRLKRKQEKKVELAKQKAAPAATTPAHNPFSTGVSNPFSNNGSNPFSSDIQSLGFGDQIMGFASTESSAPTILSTKPDESSSDEESTSDEDGDDGTNEESELNTVTKKMGEASLGPSVDWSKQPAYTPIYLETESEYLPPPPKLKGASKAVGDVNKGGGGDDWGKEVWEDSPNLDGVFVRFTARLDARPSQCVRYDLGGQPLFYQNESVYRSLHSIAAGTSVPVTGAAFAVAAASGHKTYNPTASPLLPKCPICKSVRRFECQLMPNLINKLKRPGLDQHMEWGTCLVYTCAKSCSQTEDGQELKECWREETVLVQWEE